MRVVVTGASGNVGTALLRAVAADHPGWDVTGVARRRPPPAGPYTAAGWHPLDLGDAGAEPALAELLRGTDAVVHLAWAIQPAPAEPDQNRTNLAGSAHLLRAAAAAGVPHLVCLSSVAAYRPGPRRRRVAEGWPVSGVPGSAYSRQKAALERLLDRFEADHPATVVARLRPCAVLSGTAGAEFAGWLLGPLLPAPALGRRALPVPAWPGLRFQTVHADDVAGAVVAALLRRAGGAYNLAAEPVLHRRDLAAAGLRHVTLPYPLVRAAAGATWRAGLQPLHPGWLALADRAALLATARARTELDWRPRVPAAEALAEAVTAIRDRRTGASAPLGPDPTPPRPGRPLRQPQ